MYSDVSVQPPFASADPFTSDDPFERLVAHTTLYHQPPSWKSIEAAKKPNTYHWSDPQEYRRRETEARYPRPPGGDVFSRMQFWEDPNPRNRRGNVNYPGNMQQRQQMQYQQQGWVNGQPVFNQPPQHFPPQPDVFRNVGTWGNPNPPQQQQHQQQLMMQQQEQQRQQELLRQQQIQHQLQQQELLKQQALRVDTSAQTAPPSATDAIFQIAQSSPSESVSSELLGLGQEKNSWKVFDEILKTSRSPSLESKSPIEGHWTSNLQ